ncbi:MAG: nucleotidyltransferase domain-containing protein [Actinobacteria bacterium]|nr:nucleotidyltransferase domain-containing protein [Actinomycetota bacterium]
MSLVAEYRDARANEESSRLRRMLALRALLATGSSQRDVASKLGISQPAVSQQLRASRDLTKVHPENLVRAAAPVLVDVARSQGFERLAVFGSVARGEARDDSDIDLLVDAPAGTAIKELLALGVTFEQILGRPVDLVTYGGLKAGLDDDIRREAVLL